MKLKHEAIAQKLAAEIRAGLHDRGSRLAGEHELAKRFSTSRTTVRQALAVLHEADLIATAPGRGSFVMYDDRALDDRLGWTRAMAREGISLSVRVLRIEHVRDEELARELQVQGVEMIAIDRVRHIPDGVAVSLERSRIPAKGKLRDLPASGLHHDSLQRTLRDADLVPHHGEELVDVGFLGAEEGKLLGRRAGTAFLRTRRTTWTRSGQWVEHVESLLDPEHFRLRFRLGDGQ
jgi:GntR family transcriptional regulator